MNKIFSLSLFLLLPAAAQCMEQEIVFQPKTMQDIRNERDTFKKTLDDNKLFWWFSTTSCPSTFFLECTYHQDLHKETYRKRASHLKPLQYILDEKWFLSYNIDNLSNVTIESLNILKQVRSESKLYSCLGSATMAENVSFQEKKQFIHKLLALNFTSTPGDKELALLAKYEEFESLIIKKILFLPYLLPVLEIEASQEMTKNISLFMLETEESLL